MKTVGVVVEYNPFHNGHLFHLREAKKQTGAEIVIAVMSGYFLQRGEPALLPKLTRTQMALAGGADIVIELPYAYSTQKAEVFAYGAIALLNSIGTEEVCFGSEDGNISSFTELVGFLNKNHDKWNENIKKFTKQGYSFPKATSLAFYQLHLSNKMLDLSQPNNILGYHYVKAIETLGCSMKASTISRKKANYHDTSFADTNIASATSIRKALEENNDILSVKQVVPEFTYQKLHEHYTQFGSFSTWENYFPLLKYRILTSSLEELYSIYEAEEGLEHRIFDKIIQSNSFLELMEALKTKRFTWNRLQRYCLHILTNTKKEEMQPALNLLHPTYIRLLGMTKNGQAYLNHQKKNLPIPLVSRVSQFNDPLMSLDKKAAICYALMYKKVNQSKLFQQEYGSFPYRTVKG